MTMRIRLDTPVRKWTFFASCAVFLFGYSTLITRQFLASVWGARMDRTSLERAIKLDPHNADYRDRLGQYLQHKANDPGGAVAEFQAAVQLNPNSAHYWLHLADAYVVLGETANQTAALEHAIQADPTTPDVAWEAGN